MGSFILLDCGLWAGSGNRHAKKRSFGVVYGNWAWLCEFVSARQGNFQPTPTVDAGRTNAFFQALHGTDRRLRIVRRKSLSGTRSRQNSMPSVIELFIPDMHMPMLRGYPDRVGSNYAPDGPKTGRLNYTQREPGPPTGNPNPFPNRQDGTVQEGGQRVLGWGAESWFRTYAGADIHEDASTDMIEFLERVERYCHDNQSPTVNLIQLGDMLELWVGFNCYFENVPWSERIPAGENRVRLSPGGRQFVSHWVTRARGRHPGGTADELVTNDRTTASCIYRMSREPDRLEKTFLWGNHDCYLARVNLPRQIGKQRVQNYTRDRLFAEHGHQGDSNNRDGNRDAVLAGHRVTQVGAFYQPWLRRFRARSARKTTSVGGAQVLPPHASEQCVRDLRVCSHAYRGPRQGEDLPSPTDRWSAREHECALNS